MISANRAIVRVVRKNSGNLVYLKYSRKTLYYFEFLNSLPVSEHLFYLCSNPFELPKFLYVFAYYLGSFFSLFFLLSRPVFVLLVFCFCTCFVLLFVFVSIFSRLLDSKAF